MSIRNYHTVLLPLYYPGLKQVVVLDIEDLEIYAAR